MNRVEMAIRIKAGTGDVPATRIDDEGTRRYACCGTPIGGRPYPHDMVECLAKALVSSDDQREVRAGADLIRWQEERTYGNKP